MISLAQSANLECLVYGMRIFNETWEGVESMMHGCLALSMLLILTQQIGEHVRLLTHKIIYTHAWWEGGLRNMGLGGYRG